MDFELILMVLVYDDYDDEMKKKIWIDENEEKCEDWNGLFVGMNDERNWMNDVNDYDDDVNVSESDIVNGNENEKGIVIGIE